MVAVLLKEAYSSGIADLVTALHAWSASKQGRRAGSRVGFPGFKARHRDRGRVRFSTGAMRLEPDRRHLTLPVIGTLRSKENTRRLERLLVKGRARVLSMTLSEQSGRLFVSVATVVAQAPRRPSEPSSRCGIDLGIGAEWAVVAHGDGTIERITHPAPWAAVRGSAAALPGACPAASLGPEATTKRKPSWRPLTGARPTCAASPSTPSPPGLPAATARSSSRTSILPRWAKVWVGARSDAASTGLGSARSAPSWPTRRAGPAGNWSWLTAGWPPPRLITAAAAIRLTSPGRAGLGLSWLRRAVDRNANAALNLRDWTGPVNDRDVQRGGVAAPVPLVGDHDGQAHAPGVGVRGPVRPPRGGEGRRHQHQPPGARNPNRDTSR